MSTTSALRQGCTRRYLSLIYGNEQRASGFHHVLPPAVRIADIICSVLCPVHQCLSASEAAKQRIGPIGDFFHVTNWALVPFTTGFQRPRSTGVVPCNQTACSRRALRCAGTRRLWDFFHRGSTPACACLCESTLKRPHNIHYFLAWDLRLTRHFPRRAIIPVLIYARQAPWPALPASPRRFVPGTCVH